MKSIFYPPKKRGNLFFDSVVGSVLLFTGIVVTFIMIMFVSDVNEMWQDEDSLSNYSKEVMEQTDSNMAPLFDNLFLFFLLGLWLAMLLTAFLIDTHPAFFFVSLLMTIVIIVVGMYLTEAYTEVVGEGEFAVVSSEMPKMHYIMSNLPIFLFIMGVSTAVVLYGKVRQ